MVIFELNNAVIVDGLTTEEEKILHEMTTNKFLAEMSLEKLSKTVLPRPVVCDDDGKLIKDYTARDFYLKLQKEIFEMEDVRIFGKHRVSEKIADVITLCISYLNTLGYGEKERSEIFSRVNEKNEKREYLKKLIEVKNAE